nr:E360 [uncultured bacterium]
MAQNSGQGLAATARGVFQVPVAVATEKLAGTDIGGSVR